MNSFLFGAATASYQIEGAVTEDGRGPSVWDDFSHTPGKIRTGETGDRACDHYHRMKEDVMIMSRLGLDAYRFSIAWPRVVPDGDGAVNQAGLDFYDRLADALAEAGIVPFATLFHWDLPSALQKKYGGFADRRCAEAYVRYVEAVTARLGDRVKHWITFNEPWVYSVVGHMLGIHAPGKKNPWQMMRVAHHQLLAHGMAVDVIRAAVPDARVGITLNLAPIHPRSGSEKDRKAAFLADQFLNRFYLDPVFKKEYPRELWKKIGPVRPKVRAGDMDIIGRKIDFLGINNYTRERAYHKRRPLFPFHMTGMDIPETEFEKDGVRYTAMGWEVYPEGLYELLTRIRDEYGNPVTYITENGAAFTDRPENGVVNDRKRIEFLEEYTASVMKAEADGCNVRGYFVWTLIDNFEWAEGYAKRFGLVHVDFETGERTVKESGKWYSGYIDRCKKERGAK